MTDEAAAEPDTDTTTPKPPCIVCGRPVDPRTPHVVLTNTVRTLSWRGEHIHAQRVLGTWHKPCARTWPIPYPRRSPD